MICERTVKKFCNEDISLIANYDLAITDMKNTWECHHRLEIGKNGEVISRKDLIKHGLYYHRPASELIFLTKGEHRKLHRTGKKHSEESRRKMSDADKGRQLSEEHRRNLSKALKGRTLSEEHRRNIGESRKGENHPFFGKHLSEEHRIKLSEAKKNISEETRRKISEARRAYEKKRKMSKE